MLRDKISMAKKKPNETPEKQESDKKKREMEAAKEELKKLKKADKLIEQGGAVAAEGSNDIVSEIRISLDITREMNAEIEKARSKYRPRQTKMAWIADAIIQKLAKEKKS